MSNHFTGTHGDEAGAGAGPSTSAPTHHALTLPPAGPTAPTSSARTLSGQGNVWEEIVQLHGGLFGADSLGEEEEGVEMQTLPPLGNPTQLFEDEL